jgi:hypothetical protein
MFSDGLLGMVSYEDLAAAVAKHVQGAEPLSTLAMKLCEASTAISDTSAKGDGLDNTSVIILVLNPAALSYSTAESRDFAMTTAL